MDVVINKSLELDKKIDTSDFEKSISDSEKYNVEYAAGRNGARLYIDKDSINSYKYLVSNIQKLNSNLSEKYVSKRIVDMLLDLIRNITIKDNSAALDKLIDHITNYSNELIVYVPLDGIDTIEVPMEKLGEVELVIMGNKEIPLLSTNPVLKERDGQVFAKIIIINSDNDEAARIAIIETENAIDLIRFAAATITPKSSFKHSIGIEGKAIFSHQSVLILDPREKSITNSFKSLNESLTIDKEFIEHMSEIGIFLIADAIRSIRCNRISGSSAEPFQITLLRGIHWFACSQTQVELENKFINIMFCLETLLSQQNYPVGTVIGENLAILIEENKDQRINIKKDIKDCYDKRSDVVHGRASDITSEKLLKIADYAGRLIRILIKRKDEFKSRKELDEWLEIYRLGALKLS